ncbi:MAG: hypothetical protein IPO87_10740 [Flavobacteriales bacterium]|nr:hypothetical protein [Flavobacteriales bacterium]
MTKALVLAHRGFFIKEQATWAYLADLHNVWTAGPLDRWTAGPLGRWAVGPLSRCLSTVGSDRCERSKTEGRWDRVFMVL